MTSYVQLTMFEDPETDQLVISDIQIAPPISKPISTVPTISVIPPPDPQYAVQARQEISDFIQSLHVPTQLNFPVGHVIYDIYIPSINLLVEYNALYTHSEPGSKQKDVAKYKHAIAAKFSFLSIFEDEWLHGRAKVETLIKNKLSLVKPISIRPQKCSIRMLTNQIADPFYELHHYIGRCRSSINYGVYFENQLIACASFKHPTRQSTHSFELVRMVSHPGFRVHGIWSKLLQRFIREYNPKTLVSFSDNRLFPGGVYEKIGFKHDGNIPSDYYWYKGTRRHHKSGLRKKKHEIPTGKTEYVLREEQGYKRVWDLGKKRWVLINEHYIEPPPQPEIISEDPISEDLQIPEDPPSTPNVVIPLEDWLSDI
jgi:hypothetical protein